MSVRSLPVFARLLCPVELVSPYIVSTLLMDMLLYDQIRYAEATRAFYRLRGRPSGHVSSSIVGSLGYAKYSNQFYAVKKLLKQEGVLDREGRFVNSAPNVWLAELPQIIPKKEMKVLGDEIPYTVFAAAVFGTTKRLGSLAKELHMSRSSVYYAASRLVEAGLLQITRNEISPVGSAKEWLLKYIEACKTHVDVTGDIPKLFRAVPGYIDGPRAYYALHHEVGMPIGRSNMIIATMKPFINFWTSIVTEIRYFKEYGKGIKIALASPSPDPGDRCRLQRYHQC